METNGGCVGALLPLPHSFSLCVPPVSVFLSSHLSSRPLCPILSGSSDKTPTGLNVFIAPSRLALQTPPVVCKNYFSYLSTDFIQRGEKITTMETEFNNKSCFFLHHQTTESCVSTRAELSIIREEIAGEDE